MRLFFKRILVIACAIIGLFGIAYNIVALPFSSPAFDIISWVCICISALVLTFVGRKK